MVLLTALLSPVLVSVADSPASATGQPGASTAATWLASQLDDGRYANPLAAGPDHGLMMDAVVGMYSAGRGDLAQPILRHLDDDEEAQDYYSYSGWQPRPDQNRIGGAVAKTVVTALVSGRDPRRFGGADLVAELDGVITASGREQGRVRDHGPLVNINNANTFGQSLAVLAYAGLGDNRQDVIDKLLWQQCGAGYFRIFYSYNTDQTLATCDEGLTRDRSAPDGDSTGIALSALAAARSAGVSGLDDAIDRARAWLVANQLPDGGWGGGVGTEAANTNSTGLIVQALVAVGGADAAVASGQRYLLSAQVSSTDMTNDLRDDLGAIAYQPAEYQAARVGGIGWADTWIRASAQAVLGLSGVSMYDLVTENVPVASTTTVPKTTVPTTALTTTSSTPTPRPTTTTTPASVLPPGGAPGPNAGPTPALAPSPRAGTPGVRRGTLASRVPGRASAPEATEKEGEGDPASRLASFLAGHLVDGDHLEAEVDGEVVVDYDGTADVALALRTLDGESDVARRVTSFLLDQGSVDAYVRGVPYETEDAIYAEPLAKLLVLAEFQRRDPGAPPLDPTVVSDLHGSLDRARGRNGFPVDQGAYGDARTTAVRQAWMILALTAGGEHAEVEIGALLDAACDDGSFPSSLGKDCSTGDPVATAAALTALVASANPADDAGAPRSATSSEPPSGWSEQRARAANAAAAFLDRSTDDRGLVASKGRVDLIASSAAAGARSFTGVDVSATTNAIAELQLDDGGFAEERSANVGDPVPSAAVAPAVAGRSWVSAPGSPVRAAVRLHRPVAEETSSPEAQPRVVPDATGDPESTPDASRRIALALGGLVLAVAVGGTTLRRRRHPSPRSAPSA